MGRATFSGFARPTTNIHAYPVQYAPIEPTAFFRDSEGALYAHIPFCTKKCHFCDFAITTVHDGDLRQRYVDALLDEIAAAATSLPVPRSDFRSLYIGGGTPGLLTGEQLGRIHYTLSEAFGLSADAEVGVEFDPATVTEEKTEHLIALGFNRLSVGVQTFDDDVLSRINRAHDAATAVRAIDVLVNRAKRVDALVNLDLIFPLPGLTGDAWLDGVRRAIDSGAACITLYGLEIWPRTVFHAWRRDGTLTLPGREAEIEMHLAAIAILRAAGFRPGAASGWLAPSTGRPYSVYLDRVWSGDPVLGFGVSARSTIGARSWTNVRSIPTYLRRRSDGVSPVEHGCVRNSAQSMRQHVIRGFKRGYVDAAAFGAEFGFEVGDVFPREIESLMESGLVDVRGEVLDLTDLGRVLVANVAHMFTTANDAKGDDTQVQIGVSFR